jgi:tetratricopeptide (TPR) repeat protein
VSAADLEARIASLWDFGDPAGTAAVFDAAAETSDDPTEASVLRTQQARAVGLAGDFAAADAILDGIDVADSQHARARLAIERGRVLNSTGDPRAAATYFATAYALASACGAGGLAIDALHMSAIAGGAVDGPDAARAWDERALAEIDRSDDPSAEAWRGTILNNLGWDLHDSGRLDEALRVFERAVVARIEAGQHERILTARWCVGRALRSLGRYDEALALMRTLAADPDGAQDEYVHQEIAENLKALEETRPD